MADDSVLHKNRRSHFHKPVLFIALAGIVLSAGIFNYLRAMETRKIRAEFKSAANIYEYVIRREIESNLIAVNSVKAYAEVTPKLDAEAFETYAGECAKSFPSILSLEWAPVIKDSERAAFELGLKSRGIVPPYVRGAMSRDPAPAAVKDLYYPISLMYPRDYANRVIGYDLGTKPQSRKVLERAELTGVVSAGQRVPIVEKSQDGFGVPVYLAVFDASHQLRGFVLTLFQMGDVLARGLGKLKPEPVYVQFFDLTAPPGNRRLYAQAIETGGVETPAPSQRKAKASSEMDALRPGDFKEVMTFEVAGREWAMVLTPQAGYFSARRTTQPWTGMAAVLAAAALITAFLIRNISHARREAELRHLRSRQVAEEALRHSEERYALAARGSKDGLWDWDLRSGRIYYSARWKSMLGYEESEIQDVPGEWLERIYPAERPKVKAAIRAHCFREAPDFQCEHRVRHKDGSYRWMLSRGVAVFDDAGMALRIAGSQTDVTDGKNADALTGLASRICMVERLEAALARSRAFPEEVFAVLFLDVDRFKVINDSLGHMAGDKLLKQVAGRLRASVKSARPVSGESTLARLGGDEFAVLASGLSGIEEALAIAEAIRVAMEPAFDLDENRVFISFSTGVRLGDPDLETEDHLRDADTAMYRAKAGGRGQSRLFDAPMREQAKQRLQLEGDLRAAIESGGLVLYYQPKVSLASCRMTGLEALVRWNHPGRGLLAPADFIPLAEEAGLTEKIGAWVLAEACRQMAEWNRAFDVEPDMGVSVNLFPRQLAQPDLPGQIQKLLRESGLQPANLRLEIRESAVVESLSEGIDRLKELRSRGLRLSLDDFGTGSSSLSSLHQLPFDWLKVDRGFVRDMTTKRESLQIVRTIVTLARALGMKTIAEGVESHDQLAILRSLGCDLAQGFLFSPPVDGRTAGGFFLNRWQFMEPSFMGDTASLLSRPYQPT